MEDSQYEAYKDLENDYKLARAREVPRDMPEVESSHEPY